MNGFDLTVRLFALLLGFSIAEVLGGFARTLRLKLALTPVSPGSTRVGWLVPLLGLLVVMEQMSFWMAFYVLEAHVPASFFSMLFVLFIVGGFYVVSTLIFPAHPERWPDFDTYYFRVKTAVIGALLGLQFSLYGVGIVIAAAGDTLTAIEEPTAVGIAAALIQLPLLGALLFSRRREASLVLLLLCNATLVIRAVSLLS